MRFDLIGGSKNVYQQYLKKYGSGKEYSINVGDNEHSRKEVEHYQRRFGKITVSTSAKFHVDVEDTTIVPRSNDNNTEDYLLNRGITMVYDMRDTVLKVNIFRYGYSSVSYKEDADDNYKWTDGFALNATRSDVISFEFDINKYFENGKLTAEDATSEVSIDASKVSTDMVGMDSKKYTERNAEWDEKVIDDVLDLVNDMLGEIDKIVAEKIN